jgi:predicted nucleic acid-binding protein
LTETLVIDASVVVKWVVEEEGSTAATALRHRFRLAAPDLLVAECANILWKKTRRGELTAEEANIAARLLERAGIELMPMGGLLEKATGLAIQLAHPAYDCIYLALAQQKGWRFATADIRLLRAVAERAGDELAQLCLSLSEVESERP